MSNDTTVRSGFLPITFFWTAFVVFNLSSCGSGESDYPPNPIPPSSPNTPIVHLTATSTSIAYNASTVISWTSTNSTSCTSSGGGGTGTSGSFNTAPLTATTTFIVTCSGAGGSGSDSLTITVAPSVITGFSDAGSGNVTVTSANDLINGSIITISGTTNYNGTYTVSNVTSSSFTIVHSFSGNDATGSWQLAGGMISGCSTTGATSAITLSTTISRFNGVAPLAVFFDASSTTTTPATLRPFHDLEYRWDFGDPAGSTVLGTTWKAGSGWNETSMVGTNSRNSTTGPVAAHVFETPGVYLVTLSATDGTNNVLNSCAQIVVQNPDDVFSGTNTICFSTSGTFTDCPSGATHVTTSNFATAIGTYQASGRRLLFRRGETFTASTPASITADGPGNVGAYGTGAAPIINKTNNSNILVFSSIATPYINDWRVMDLDFNANGIAGVQGIAASGTIKQLTILRMYIHNIEFGILLNGSVLDLDNEINPGHTVFDEITIADSVISPISGDATGWRIYAFAQRLSILGNTLGALTGTASGSHVIRTPYIGKGVISNNTIARAAINLGIKMHGPSWCDVNSPVGSCNTSGATYSYVTNTKPIGIFSATNGYTEQVVVSDNRFIGYGTPYLIALGPQNNQMDERVRNVIVERNFFQAGGSSTRSAVEISASEVTVRNNICNLTGGSNGRFCVNPRRAGGGTTSPAPIPDQIRIYNNTAYSSDASSDFAAVLLEVGVTNIYIMNNLAYAPLATNSVLINSSECGASCFTASDNSSNFQVKNTSPLFIVTPPVLITDWKLQASSYGITDLGANIPVWSDFFRISRPQNGSIDMGATEQ